MVQGQPETGFGIEQGEYPVNRELVGCLLEDFRNSFRFSQGDPFVQKIFFTLLRDEYAKSPDNGLLIPAALTVVQERAERLALPLGHKEISPVFRRQESRDAFAIFSKCLTDPAYIPKQTEEINEEEWDKPLPLEHAKRLDFLVIGMAIKEMKFLEDPNTEPGARGGSDPYESYLRTYVLGGADTDSNAYNTIFGEARHLLITRHPDTGLEQHKSLWESRHPAELNEAYYPQTYLDELERYSTTMNS